MGPSHPVSRGRGPTGHLSVQSPFSLSSPCFVPSFPKANFPLQLAGGGGVEPTSSTLWPCALGRQDKLQTETQKDFWTIAQWADSVRRWLSFQTACLGSARPSPPLLQPTAARPPSQLRP